MNPVRWCFVKFEAVFFDLYNTLLHFDFSVLPRVDVRGQKLPTTSVEVHRQVEKKFKTNVPYQCFLEEFLESMAIISRIRKKEDREVPCLERFQIMCRRLNIDVQAADFMTQVHMDEMFRTMYCPEKTKILLERLSDIPLVLASNFDHAPTVRRALRSFELEHRFMEIFISDEVGCRKPGRKFFEIILKKSGHDPSRCLYVGDDAEADVLGAVREGFQVAWLVEGGASEDPPATPRWVIEDLLEVLNIVEKSVGEES